jgi:hypothetical protein
VTRRFSLFCLPMHVFYPFLPKRARQAIANEKTCAKKSRDTMVRAPAVLRIRFSRD